MSGEGRVIALGFFDGVHLGHQALMARARERASSIGARAAAVTFDQHPDRLVRGASMPLLSGMEDRKELISRVGGIDEIIVLHFNSTFMQTPWEDFVNDLAEEYDAVHLVMGRDFCCGWRGLGTAERIAAWCAENGLGCDIVDQVSLDGVVVSSTYIRRLVEAGEMEAAARHLGHPHCISHTVVHGYQRGRRMGIPTVNIPIPEDVIVPRRGVYASRVWLPDGPQDAVTNVGVCPTFAGDGRVTVESNLLDFSGELYGARVRVEFLHFLRDEKRFADADMLAGQILRDMDAARQYLR